MRLIELQVDPRPVAIARMGIGVATVLMSLEAFEILARISSGLLAAPVFPQVPELNLISLILLAILQVAAGSAVTLGWRTEFAAGLSLVLSLVTFLADQQTYSNHRLLVTLLLAYLLFAKSGTAWSLRRTRRPGLVPFWPQLLMMTQLSVVYFFSAISKINPTFASGKPLETWVWVSLPWQAYTIAAIMTIVVELVIAFGLWFRASRRVAALLGVGLHLSIVVLMDHETLALTAFAVVCVSLYPLFLTRPQFHLRGAGLVVAAAGRPHHEDPARSSEAVDAGERLDHAERRRRQEHDEEHGQ
ncbi:HTTM domain-containing protein [Agromyces sp. SYSU T00266]|uniref:HTTM domain-containing protein n=1 Tax=Agromyces zhanjiangensis TaxID=3158562 RepID=UPI003397CBC6